MVDDGGGGVGGRRTLGTMVGAGGIPSGYNGVLGMIVGAGTITIGAVDATGAAIWIMEA